MGIANALQLAQTNPSFIRKNFNVVLERTVRELNGKPCISLEESAPAKQQICCSRSFGERITSKVAMQEALCQYATCAGEKLTLPTQDKRDIIDMVMRLLDRIWLEGRRYMKADIMLDNFTPDGMSQLNLFNDTPDLTKRST